MSERGTWYKVLVPLPRAGKKEHTTNAYLFGKDINEIFDKYKRMTGIRTKLISKRFPEMTRLDDEQIGQLETTIRKDGRINLTKAKRTWYSPQ